MNRVHGFLLVWRHAAGQALRGKRGFALGALALLPVGLTLLQLQVARSIEPANFTGTMLMGVFQFVVPFGALFLGVAVLGDEIEGRTITYLFTRPLPRPAFFTGRLLGYATSFGALLAASVFLIAYLFRGPIDLNAAEIAGSMAVAVAGFTAYLAFFAVLRLLLEKALYVGFFLAFIFEGFVSKMPNSGLSRCSIWHHLALLETRLLRSGTQGMDELTQGLAATETVRGSIVFLAVFFAVCVAAGCWLVRSREIRVPAAVA